MGGGKQCYLILLEVPYFPEWIYSRNQINLSSVVH